MLIHVPVGAALLLAGLSVLLPSSAVVRPCWKVYVPREEEKGVASWVGDEKKTRVLTKFLDFISICLSHVLLVLMGVRDVLGDSALSSCTLLLELYGRRSPSSNVICP